MSDALLWTYCLCEMADETLYVGKGDTVLMSDSPSGESFHEEEHHADTTSAVHVGNQELVTRSPHDLFNAMTAGPSGRSKQQRTTEAARGEANQDPADVLAGMHQMMEPPTGRLEGRNTSLHAQTTGQASTAAERPPVCGASPLEERTQPLMSDASQGDVHDGRATSGHLYAVAGEGSASASADAINVGKSCSPSFSNPARQVMFGNTPIQRWDLIPTQREWEAYQRLLPKCQRYPTSEGSSGCSSAGSLGSGNVRSRE